MKKAKRHGNLSIRSVLPKLSTARSHTHPSAHPSEKEEEPIDISRAFKFLELPSEIRIKIYELFFSDAPLVIDLDPDNYNRIHHKFALFLVSKKIHNESSYYFYSTRTVRLFPIHPGPFFHTGKPLLARLGRRYRSYITSFELHLGPGFTKPPSGWVVNDALGLKDNISARLLKVFVEIDTSDAIYKGFRRAEDGFYEKFSRHLQSQILASMPSIIEVQFDGFESVQKNGEMMRGLIDNAIKHEKSISWGPGRGWDKEEENSRS